jgi:hypothetical protein
VTNELAVSHRRLSAGGLFRAGASVAATAVAAVAVSMSGAGVANAAVPVDPSGYLSNGTVYFSYSNMANCAIESNGNVGCDSIGAPITWFGIPVTNVSIDLPFLPAHPALGPLGTHGQPGSRQLSGTSPGPGQAYGQDGSITYAGTTCVVGSMRAEVTCTAKGHSFGFGFSNNFN